MSRNEKYAIDSRLKAVYAVDSCAVNSYLSGPIDNVDYPSDQQLDFERLSPTARHMHALREAVLAEWGERLRQTVKEALHLPHPILINTFPTLYDNLTQAISPSYPRTTGDEGNTVASEHGGERARLTHYNAQAVISEYQLLRWTIFDVLKSNGVHLTSDEFFIINASIDGSIRESVTAFALAQAALRERFMAALTHDLRNPLASASAAADLIQLIADTPRLKELATRITTDLERMDGMIQELLDAVVFQTGERLQLHIEQFDMCELAKEVRDQFIAVHGDRFTLGGPSVVGWWDRPAVKRALENLISNAVKYGDTGTPISVSLASEHERVQLTVHNVGQPIPPEETENLFQVFRRAATAKEGNTRGWGIGLPYVRTVAESHGGSVGIDSSTKTGTTFSISLPQDSRPFQNAPVLDHKQV
jgi:signal transduction histidine kinase